MFKLTKGGRGFRASGGGGRGAGSRVNANHLTSVAPLSTQSPRFPAFQPDTLQEHGFDSNSPRIKGLEMNG
jgi:hypothetical protein